MATIKHEPQTYETLDSRMTGRNSQRLKLAPNTYAERSLDTIIIRLHGNVIMELTPGWVSLMNGGWNSVTTKDRLNRFTSDNIHIYQSDFTWYVSCPENDAIPFYNGISFTT